MISILHYHRGAVYFFLLSILSATHLWNRVMVIFVPNFYIYFFAPWYLVCAYVGGCAFVYVCVSNWLYSDLQYMSMQQYCTLLLYTHTHTHKHALTHTCTESLATVRWSRKPCTKQALWTVLGNPFGEGSYPAGKAVPCPQGDGMDRPSPTISETRTGVGCAHIHKYRCKHKF